MVMNAFAQRISLTLFLLVTVNALFAQRFFPTVDTYIQESASTTVANTTYYYKLEVKKGINYNRITFMEFNIGDFSEQVSKAELGLYLMASSPANLTEVVEVYEVTSGTIDNTVTWSNFNSSYSLNATPITTLSITSGATNTASNGWCIFDIKNLINTIAATSGTNKKIKLAFKAQSTNLLLDFYSNEANNVTYPFPHYRPFLVMTPAPAVGLVEKSKTIPTQDGYVYNMAVDTKNDEQKLFVNYYKSGESKQFRYSNLRFNVPATTLNENNRVIMKTKVYGAFCDPNIVYVVDLLGINNLDDAVSVNDLTWNTMPAAGNYTYLRSRFFTLIDKTNETNVEWDVTSFVKAQQTAGKSFVNFSMQIPELGGYIGNIAFYARNYLNADPLTTNVPNLIVYGPNTPTITSITPTSAVNGTNVTIIGTNFTGATSVSFGGTAASSFSVVNATTINAIVAAGTSGSVSVTTNGGTASKTGFVWIEPTVISTFKKASDLTLIPESVINVVSGGSLTLDQSTTVNSITVASGGKLTLNNGSTLTTGALTLESGALGTATFVDANVADNPPAINGTVQQHIATTGRNWYTSIPVTTANVEALSSANAVAYWDEPNGTWATLTALSALNPLRGYISASTTSLVFTGTLNSGLKTIALTRTAGKTKEGFNLVGNPYPSFLDWSLVDTISTNITTSIWYRTKTSGNVYTFDTYNRKSNIGTNLGANTVSNLIPPMQAFWVRAKTNGGMLTFTNAMRKHIDVAGNKLKAPAVNDINQKVLRLRVSNGTNSDEAIVLFNPAALDVYDDYDSPKMTNGNNAIPEIYTVAETEQVVINGMKNMIPCLEIPLGFRTGEGRNFNIKATEIANFDSDIQIILKDNQMNIEQDLTDGTTYTFESDPTTTTQRFSIVFKSNSVTTGIKNQNEKNTDITVCEKADGRIMINCGNEIVGQATASLCNSVGQLLENVPIKNTVTVLSENIPSGLYLVNIVVNGKPNILKLVAN